MYLLTKCFCRLAKRGYMNHIMMTNYSQQGQATTDLIVVHNPMWGELFDAQGQGAGDVNVVGTT